MKYTKEICGKAYEAKIIDLNGTYAIIWPFGFDDDEYQFKTMRGAQRRLERNGWQAA